MKRAITYTLDTEGIAEILFDLPDSPVNILSFEVLDELEAILDEMREERAIKVAFFSSAKAGIFIAGADIHDIESFTDEEEAYRKVRRGQQLLSKICVLPFPTVAVIDGACLGGGFELALCCDFRLCGDNPKTKIGLPEVSLGVIPGFGGTVRLKKLVGLAKAVELIAGAKQLNGKKAELLGVVDACVPSGYLDFKRESFLKAILDPAEREKIMRRRHSLTLAERFVPGLILSFARREIMKKTWGHYPAPLALIDLYERVEGKSFAETMDAEARVFSALCVTPICKNMIRLFFTSEALKHEKGADASLIPKMINSTAVFGGGVMGAGIVWLLSKLELPVRLKVRRSEQIGTVFKEISKAYEALRKRKRLNRREIALKMDHISYDTEFEGFELSDLCVEAIVEEVAAKKELYGTLEAIVKEDAIIASNTSSLSISLLAEGMKHPERFIGMHFFNPVNRMPLVEVIAGAQTSPQTVVTVVDLAKKAGKTPIIVGDCAGFLVNRILLPYINEAIHMLGEGGDIETIDRTLFDFGMPMGPLSLADEVGLDIGFKVGRVLEEAYGERMITAPLFTRIYKEAGLLGKKSGEGFYLHSAGTRQPNPAVQTMAASSHLFDPEEIVDRCILIMVNEAARTLEESVVGSADYLDMAMVLGTGFPPFRGGLMAYAQQRGINDVVVTLNRLSNRYGMRFKPAPLLVEMAETNERFYKE